MCVICVKPSKQKVPKKGTLKKMFDTNDDGAGYAWIRGGEVHYRKGFMEFDSFYDDFKSKNFKKKDFVLFHFRIGTSGGKKQDMTHPFPITDDEEDLANTRYSGDLILAHNGVFSKLGTDDLSDTAIFVKDIIYPIKDSLLDDDLKFNKNMKPVLKQAVGSSKIVMLSPKDVMLVGDWKKEDGIYYSNKKWKPIKEVSNWNRNNYDISNYNRANYNKRIYNQTGWYNAGDWEEEDCDGIPGHIGKFLLKLGFILERKTSVKETKLFFRWNKRKNKYETLWDTSNTWKDNKLTLDSETFLLPERDSNIDDIKDKIDDELNLALSVINLSTDDLDEVFDPNDQEEAEEMEIIARFVARTCVRSEERINESLGKVDTILRRVESLKCMLETANINLMELEDEAESKRFMLDNYVFQMDVEDPVDYDSGELIGEIEGTSKPPVQTAADLTDVEFDRISPRQVIMDLISNNIRMCENCLKWRSFKSNDYCEECRND